MIRVLVADDHAIVRQGLKRILSEEFDSLILGEACSGRELLQVVERDAWDIAVLDITLSHRNGLDILRDLKLQHPKLPVLILSMHSEDQFAVRSLKAGASGYMTKENAPEELVKAIKKVLGGGRYVRANLAEKLDFELDAQARPPHETLSDREYQVLRMIAAGRTVTEIAEEPVLGVKTISTYRARVLEKLRMKANAEIPHYAIKNNLV